MKKLLLILTAVSFTTALFSQENRHYITNQKPLVEQPYTTLPIGAIQPKGMRVMW